MVAFHVRLKEVRQKSLKKQREVADCLGMKIRSYQLYEEGKTEPNIEKLIALADYFGVSLDYLMGRTDQ